MGRNRGVTKVKDGMLSIRGIMDLTSICETDAYFWMKQGVIVPTVKGRKGGVPALFSERDAVIALLTIKLKKGTGITYEKALSTVIASEGLNGICSVKTTYFTVTFELDFLKSYEKVADYISANS